MYFDGMNMKTVVVLIVGGVVGLFFVPSIRFIISLAYKFTANMLVYIVSYAVLLAMYLLVTFYLIPNVLKMCLNLSHLEFSNWYIGSFIVGVVITKVFGKSSGKPSRL